MLAYPPDTGIASVRTRIASGVSAACGGSPRRMRAKSSAITSATRPFASRVRPAMCGAWTPFGQPRKRVAGAAACEKSLEVLNHASSSSAPRSRSSSSSSFCNSSLRGNSSW